MISKKLMIVAMFVATSSLYSAAADEQKEHTVKLLRALKEGASIETIRTHIEGADINNVKNTNASLEGPCHWAVEYNRDDALEILCKNGARLNDKDWCGDTPLHYACAFGSSKCAEILLNYGANKKEKNKRGFTPLDVARDSKHQETAKFIENYHDPLEIKEPDLD